jgi:hypothetical protein
MSRSGEEAEPSPRKTKEAANKGASLLFHALPPTGGAGELGGRLENAYKLRAALQAARIVFAGGRALGVKLKTKSARSRS